MTATWADYTNDMEVRVPPDVVQWKLSVDAGELMQIHLARGNGVYELRYVDILKNNEKTWFEPGQEVVAYEKADGDHKTVFIQKEW